MAVIDLSGTTSGSGTILALTLTKLVIIEIPVSSSGSLSATFLRTELFGGQAYGYGMLEDELALALSGTTVGAGSLSGQPIRVAALKGDPSYGIWTFHESTLEPSCGKGWLTGLMHVDRVPCPIACTPIVPTFRWGQDFPPGELMIAFTDEAGIPFAPCSVVFRLFQVLSTGVLFPTGPANCRPVACQRRLGVYYVTGTAGELGQPGDWVIEWCWQKSPCDVSRVVQRCFKVLDLVAQTPGDPCRIKKYGWSDCFGTTIS